MKLRGPSSRMLWAVVGVIASLTVLVVVTYFVTSANTNTSEKKKTREVIEALQKQIADQGVNVEADRVENASKVACTTLFTYAVQEQSSHVLVDLGELVIVISTTTPGPEREAALGDGVTKVREAVDAYNTAVKARTDYSERGSPLPCPISANASVTPAG